MCLNLVFFNHPLTPSSLERGSRSSCFLRGKVKGLRNSNKQSGVSLVILLFIIIILALLSAALVRINSQSVISNAHQVIATRAFFAAESGANFQSMRIFPLIGASVCANQNFAINVNGLNGCTAQTQCSTFNVDGLDFYQVISQGQCNIGQDFQATRTIEVRMQALN